jgi:hypothetical protein
VSAFTSSGRENPPRACAPVPEGDHSQNVPVSRFRSSAAAGATAPVVRVTDVVKIEETDVWFVGDVVGRVDVGVLLIVLPVVTVGSREVICKPEVVVMVNPAGCLVELELGPWILCTGERVTRAMVGVSPGYIAGYFPVVAVLPE